MNEQKKTIFKKLDKPSLSSYKASYEFWRVVHTDTGGYMEDELEFNIPEEGNSVNIWEGDNIIYLDREQIQSLLKVLKEHKLL